MTPKQQRCKNEIQQIAQQVSETQRNLAQRQQQADQARRSPPPIMIGPTDYAARQMS